MKEVFIKIKYKLKKLSPTGREMFIEDLLEFIKNYKSEIENIKPSFFEIMTVLALWYFDKKTNGITY